MDPPPPLKKIHNLHTYLQFCTATAPPLAGTSRRVQRVQTGAEAGGAGAGAGGAGAGGQGLQGR